MEENWKRICIIAGCVLLILSTIITVLSPFVQQITAQFSGAEGLVAATQILMNLRYIATAGYLLLAAGFIAFRRWTALASLLMAFSIAAGPFIQAAFMGSTDSLAIGFALSGCIAVAASVLFYLSFPKMLPRGLAVFSWIMAGISSLTTITGTVMGTLTLLLLSNQDFRDIIALIGLMARIAQMVSGVAGTAFLICLILVAATRRFRTASAPAPFVPPRV